MRGGRLPRVLVGAVVVVVVAAAAGYWWFVVRDDAPPEAALVDRPSDTTASPGGGDDTPEGDWSVVTGEDTFVGFRITEQFPGLDNTAVVRTAAVEGGLTVSGTEITDVEITADLTEMESQDAVPPGVPGIENRVDQMRGDGLETARFPTATFTLTEPIRLAAAPVAGEQIDVEAVGELTVHGLPRTVTIPVQARWNGDVIDVAGSLEVALADHGMTPPERSFVSVAETGTMELQLTFRRAGS